jgi:acyl carrier protein
MTMPNTINKSEIVLRTIVDMLTSKLSGPGLTNSVDASTELTAVGLIDSTQLLDIILEVEQRCAVEFDPTRVDFQGALTLGTLVSAFATA